MSTAKTVFLCNALDDQTKYRREIVSDSPAATNKVFGLCKALQKSGSQVYVLSMGRGRQNGSGNYFAAETKFVQRLPVVYASFCNLPLITHLLTAWSLARCFKRLSVKHTTVNLIIYNRLWHAIPTLIIARLSGALCYLDLEDGATNDSQRFVTQVKSIFLRRVFDYLCPDGVLLASRALAIQTGQLRQLVCYGVSETVLTNRQWKRPLTVVYGGSLMEETGAGWFMLAVEQFFSTYPDAQNKFRFVVTGKGAMAAELERFASQYESDFFEFRGEISRNDYMDLLRTAHVGLCLKKPSSAMGQTTFPSKTIEIANSGLLLVSARVSDVPLVFSDETACLLSQESSSVLVETLNWVAEHPDAAENIAIAGQQQVRSRCSPQIVGDTLQDFLNNGCDVV